MKLSRKKAIELCIELWEWLAKTGKTKVKWPGWEKYDDVIDSSCWFCHYNNHTVRGDRIRTSGTCTKCPYLKKFGHCNTEEPPTYYGKWDNAQTPHTRKKYAKLFLEQIKKLN